MMRKRTSHSTATPTAQEQRAEYFGQGNGTSQNRRRMTTAALATRQRQQLAAAATLFLPNEPMCPLCLSLGKIHEFTISQS